MIKNITDNSGRQVNTSKVAGNNSITFEFLETLRHFFNITNRALLLLLALNELNMSSRLKSCNNLPSLYYSAKTLC